MSASSSLLILSSEVRGVRGERAWGWKVGMMAVELYRRAVLVMVDVV